MKRPPSEPHIKIRSKYAIADALRLLLALFIIDTNNTSFFSKIRYVQTDLHFLKQEIQFLEIIQS